MKQPDMNGAKRFIRPVVYGLLSGVAVCLALLLIMSVIMGMRDIPETAVSVFAVLTFAAGGFAAGYISASFARERGMLLGLCCGVCLFLIVLLAYLAVDGSPLGIQAVTKLVAVLCASAIGGITGVNKRRKFR